MLYRPEIDGLRALAILPVVLYHAGFAFLPGGFVGVDIFFVISGFLITSIVVDDIERGRFSIAYFYERRARRILPVFFAVAATCLVLGWITLPPDSLRELTDSAAAATLFVSNIHFWQSVNYFSSDAEFWPLLHTWSLAVEEQFYVFFPLLLMVLLPRAGRRWTTCALLMILALSLAGCIVGSFVSPAATFYLLPTRLWEIGVGAWLALGFLTPRPRSAGLREVLAGLGAGLIATAILAFPKDLPFPGWWALLPTTGTALIILCGGETRVARALSCRPVVFIGLISYSLYLWHWPVLVFARYGFGLVDLPWPVITACLFVMIALAVLSWKYIEAPFRNRRNLTRSGVFTLSAASAASVLTIAAVSLATGGAPQRLTSQEADVAASIRDFRGAADCWGRDPADGLCRLGRADRPATVLLWGDSHASAMSPALDAVLTELGIGGLLATYGGCAPFPGVLRSGGTAQRRRCLAFNNRVLAWLNQGHHEITHVVVTARWNGYVTGTRVQGEAGDDIVLFETDGQRGINAEIVEKSLRNTVANLTDAGISVTLLDDVPEIAWNVPVTYLFRSRIGLPAPAPPDREEVNARSAQTLEMMVAIASETEAQFISLTEDLCKPICDVMHNGRPIYADDDHLSVFGARNVVAPLLLSRWTKRIEGRK